MSNRVVCDASVLVAMLVDGGTSGRGAAAALQQGDLLAPHLALFETANVLRRLEGSGLISTDQAAQAHADLLDLPIDLWPYELLAARVWQLRRNLSIYDASYVALAELTNTPLVTLDRKLSAAPEIGCPVLIP